MNTLMTDCIKVNCQTVSVLADPTMQHKTFIYKTLPIRLAWVGIVVAAGVLLAGCGNKLAESRQQAYENWNHVRAQAVCAQAAEHLRLGQLKLACKRAREAIVLDEDYHVARIVLAKAYIERGQYTSAAVELRRVLRQRLDSAEALYLLAVADEKSGKLTDALAEYRRAYELDDTNFQAVLAAAEVLVALNKPREAREYLQGHLDRADGDPAAYELAGRLAMMNQDYAAAARHFRSACEIDMDNPNYVEALGLALVYAGQLDQAKAQLTYRTELPARPIPAWVYTMLGDCHLADSEFVAARQAYREACDLVPDEPAAWVDLAKACLAVRDSSGAIEAATRALAADADCFEAYLVKGYALLQGGEPARAIEVLRSASGADTNDYTLLCVLGQAYQKVGNLNEARRCYRRAAQLSPDGPLGQALLADVSDDQALAEQ